jgi:hypothetical protein
MVSSIDQRFFDERDFEAIPFQQSGRLRSTGGCVAGALGRIVSTGKRRRQDIRERWACLDSAARDS